MTLLTPKTVKEKLDNERDKVCFIDVRSQDEYRSGHVPGSICMPLDTIENGTAQIPTDKLVVLSCRSGMRSAKAKEILRSRGYTNLAEMEGGYLAWTACALPTGRISKSIPVMRQVLLTAGIFVFSGTMLGLFVHPGFFAIPAFMGAGLTFAGATGWCGMAFILERMPWNRNSTCSAA